MMPMTKMKAIAVEKLRSRKRRWIEEGVARRRRVDDEHPEAGDKQAEFDKDLGRLEPVELFAAVEHQLQGADGDREKREAEEIESPDALGRLGHEEEDAGSGQQSDRQVDVETPAPAEIFGQPGAEASAR